MSLEAVQAFRTILADDPALQKLCAQAARTGDVRPVVDAAAARGLHFDAAELQAAVADGELSDTELELVAGGGDPGAVDKQTTARG